MINQFFTEAWAVGVHGFYLKQLTGDSGDGALLGYFKGEAAGVGPAVLWNTKIGAGRYHSLPNGFMSSMQKIESREVM